MSEISKQEIVNTQPISITLTRGQRGGYGWEVRVMGSNEAEVIEKIKSVDEQLKKMYGGETNE